MDTTGQTVIALLSATGIFYSVYILWGCGKHRHLWTRPSSASKKRRSRSPRLDWCLEFFGGVFLFGMAGSFLTTSIHTWISDPGKRLVTRAPRTQMPSVASPQPLSTGRFSYDHESPEPDLTGADLSHLPIHDEDVRAFVSNAPNVTWLNLGDTQITDACLPHLKEVSGLSDLTLQATAITDSGLVHVARIPGLKALSLSGTGITDAGLVHLQGMTALRHLDLRNTGITDAGLKFLRPLVNLEEIMLYDTQVSPTGLKHFPEQVPRL